MSALGRISVAAIGNSVADLEAETLRAEAAGVECVWAPELFRAADTQAAFLSGRLVSRPPVVAERGLAPSQLACLRLTTALVRPDIDLTEVELAVRSDPALTMRVLKAVNSAGGVVVGKDGKPNVDTPEALAALQVA